MQILAQIAGTWVASLGILLTLNFRSAQCIQGLGIPTYSKFNAWAVKVRFTLWGCPILPCNSE